MRTPSDRAYCARSSQSSTVSQGMWTATPGAMPVNLCAWAASSNFCRTFCGAPACRKTPKRVPLSAYPHEGVSTSCAFSPVSTALTSTPSSSSRCRSRAYSPSQFVCVIAFSPDTSSPHQTPTLFSSLVPRSVHRVPPAVRYERSRVGGLRPAGASWLLLHQPLPAGGALVPRGLCRRGGRVFFARCALPGDLPRLGPVFDGPGGD